MFGIIISVRSDEIKGFGMLHENTKKKSMYEKGRDSFNMS